MAVRLVVRPPGGQADYALTFDQQKIAIGRGAGVDLRLPHAAVSELHAVIRLEGHDYLLLDPGSTNGTTHNGTPIVRGRTKLLRSGDVIGAAGFDITFRAGAAMEGLHTAERTVALARRMIREAIDALGSGGAPPRITFLDGPRRGERIDLGPPPSVLVLGRGEGNDVVLDDADASRRHCEIRREPDCVTIRDLGAKNVVLVGDEPISERVLKDRDEILVGSTRLVFEDPADAYLADLQKLEADAPIAPPPTDAESAEVPPTRVGPTPAQDPPAVREVAPAPALRERRAARGASVGDWIVIAIGVVVLAGSIVAIFYVFQ